MPSFRHFLSAALIGPSLLYLACGHSVNANNTSANNNGAQQSVPDDRQQQAANQGPNGNQTPIASNQQEGTPQAQPAPFQPLNPQLQQPQPLNTSQPLTIPEGTTLAVRLDESLSSARNRSGDRFEATLTRPIPLESGQTIPQGARVAGRVVAARPAGHLKTPAELSITLTALNFGGNAYTIDTSHDTYVGKNHNKHNLKWIGGSAAGGALLGGLIGHGKGLAIGSLVGAGGGTAGAYATGKKDIVLPAETPVRFVLREPVTMARG
jgi:hypothetical protein